MELDLPISAGMNVGPAGFFIQSVAAFASGYGLVIAYQPADETASPIVAATALIPSLNFTPNSVFGLGGVGDFTDTVGKVVIGSLTNIDAQPPGTWTFALANSRIDPDCIRPIIRGVSSLICVNGAQTSPGLYGDVEFVAGSNMQIIPILQEGQDPIIVFNAINGEGTVDSCACTGDATPSAPIQTINGIPPDNTGNFNLLGSTCVAVTAIQNGAQVADTCSQPCCGCSELEAITTDLETLQSQAAAVNQFANQMQNSVNTMALTVLGSQLGDGCSTCS